ncbi:hypothetical protein ACHWQZ_G014131 [Mnemiopsis leidyi]
MVTAASTLDNPSFVRSVYAQCLACLLHLVSSTLWVVSLSSAYWSRGSYSFLLSRDAVHTVGIWKTCVTYIEYEPYSKTWLRRDGACWATSRYLFDKRIEISSILSFVSCMWIAVILALNGLLYTAKTWRPFIRQVALPGSKLCQMLVGLAMILVFSEATDVSYNVRLWARHLAMATIVLQASEVLFLLCVGLSYKTWHRGVRDLCADISIYVSGSAHRPPPPRSTVIMNTSCGEEGRNLPPLPPTGHCREILPPHEMRDYFTPEVEIRALKWEDTRQRDHVILDLEGGLSEDEDPVALHSTSGCRTEKYPKAFRNLFGRTEQTKRRVGNLPPRTSTPSIMRSNPDGSQVDLDQILEALPIPPTSRNSYNPREEELSVRDDSTTESSCKTITPAVSAQHDNSVVSITNNNPMKGRKLPSIPGANFRPVPKQVSQEVTKHSRPKINKPREVRIVEKDLRGLFKETSSRV